MSTHVQARPCLRHATRSCARASWSCSAPASCRCGALVSLRVCHAWLGGRACSSWRVCHKLWAAQLFVSHVHITAHKIAFRTHLCGSPCIARCKNCAQGGCSPCPFAEAFTSNFSDGLALNAAAQQAGGDACSQQALHLSQVQSRLAVRWL